MNDPSLYLYGTPACHLCDQAEILIVSVLENAAECLKHVDISSSDALAEQYGTSIPLLLGQDQNGSWQELAWPFDASALIRFLEGLE